MTDGDNKRRHERYPVSKPVEATTSAGTQGGELVDISAGGAAIVAPGAFSIAVGEPVELRVENFEALPGHVVRANGGIGFAIAFDADAGQTHETIRGIVGRNDDKTEDDTAG